MSMNKEDRIPAIIAGILVGGALIMGNNNLSTPTNTSNNISGLRECAKPKYNEQSFIPKDTNSVNGRKTEYRYWLQILSEAEDEYWEIEHIDGNYYKVRREDWDDLDGYYEMTLEEPVGDLQDLVEYAKKNRNTRVYRGL